MSKFDSNALKKLAASVSRSIPRNPTKVLSEEDYDDEEEDVPVKDHGRPAIKSVSVVEDSEEEDSEEDDLPAEVDTTLPTVFKGALHPSDLPANKKEEVVSDFNLSVTKAIMELTEQIQVMEVKLQLMSTSVDMLNEHKKTYENASSNYDERLSQLEISLESCRADMGVFYTTLDAFISKAQCDTVNQNKPLLESWYDRLKIDQLRAYLKSIL